MDVIAQEREWERQRRFFAAAERAADYRAGIIAAQVLNAVGGKKFWEPVDFFPHLKADEAAAEPTRESREERVRRFLKEGTIPQDDDAAGSVRYLREGFQGMKDAMLANAAL